MGKAQKRARKKEFRDAREAEWAAAERRRRMALYIAAAVAVLALVGFAIGSSLVGGDEDGGKGGDVAAGGNGGNGGNGGGAVACGAEAPAEAAPQEYAKAPPHQLEEGVDYRAIVHTSCGDIELDLLEEDTPATVSNFVFLAEEGYFDGLIWHRVESSVIQTGDPNGLNGQPPDGPGYAIKDELPKEASEYVYGVVGMANSGPGTAGSQWFIVTHKEGPAGFQPLYAIFATVDEASFAVLDEIGKQPTQGGSDPTEAVKPKKPIYIETIEIVEA